MKKTCQQQLKQIGLNILGWIRWKLNINRNTKPVGLVYYTDIIKTRHMHQFGIGISIGGTKSYVELDIAKLPQLAVTVLPHCDGVSTSSSKHPHWNHNTSPWEHPWCLFVVHRYRTLLLSHTSKVLLYKPTHSQIAPMHWQWSINWLSQACVWYARRGDYKYLS